MADIAASKQRERERESLKRNLIGAQGNCSVLEEIEGARGRGGASNKRII